MSDATYKGKMPTIDDFCNPEPNEQKEMFPGYPDFLFTPEEFKKAKSRQPMKCRCTECGKFLFIGKNQLQAKIKANQANVFCSRSCIGKYSDEMRYGRCTIHLGYVCQTCGKEVSVNDYYGSGRFCSKRCANTYSSRINRNDEVNRRIGESLRKTFAKKHQNNPPKIKLAKPKSRIHQPQKLNQPKKKKQTALCINNIILTPDMLALMLQNWCIKDITKLYKLNEKSLKKYALLYGLQEPQIFVSTKSHAVIAACRHALNKPLEAA